ncbi:MAG: hypothetical protein AAF389_03265 [Gemmatimonadota bacterium]
MMRILLIAMSVGTLAGADPSPMAPAPGSSPLSGSVGDLVCATGPEYYAFELFTTKNIPGTGLAKGHASVSVSGASPFSVALTEDGSYRYDVSVQLERMRTPRGGTLVAWVTTPNLDQVARLGALDENLSAAGSVEWNKFIVFLTLEPSDDPAQTTWTGPVAFRGMSRSGMMHTMVGHGALQQENCAAYGYGN